MNKIRFFRDVCHLQNEILLEKISACAVEKIYKPKDCILQQGTKAENFWFLVDGVIRSYCYDEGGKEINEIFVSQPGVVSNNVVFDRTGIFGEKAVNTVTVLEIPYDVAAEFVRDYPDMQRLWLEQILRYAQVNWYLRTMCSEMDLLQQMRLFQRIDPVSYEAANNVQLASFFGVTREAVSRLINSSAAEADTALMDGFAASVEKVCGNIAGCFLDGRNLYRDPCMNRYK